MAQEPATFPRKHHAKLLLIKAITSTDDMAGAPDKNPSLNDQGLYDISENLSSATPWEQSPSLLNAIASLFSQPKSKSLIDEESVQTTHMNPASATVLRPKPSFRSRKQRFSTKTQKCCWKGWHIFFVSSKEKFETNAFPFSNVKGPLKEWRNLNVVWS